MDFSEIRNVLSPFVSIFLRNEVGDVYTLRRLPVFLLVPEELLHLQLQLLDDFFLLAGQSNSTELLLLQLNLVLLLPPQLSGDGHESMREEDDDQKHPKGIGGSHQNRGEFLQVELILEKQVNKEGNAEDGKYPVNDKVIDDCSFELISRRELSGRLKLLSNRKEEPRQDEDGVIDDLPDYGHGVVTLQGMVDIVGQEHDDDEAEEPG